MVCFADLACIADIRLKNRKSKKEITCTIANPRQLNVKSIKVESFLSNITCKSINIGPFCFIVEPKSINNGPFCLNVEPKSIDDEPFCFIVGVKSINAGPFQSIFLLVRLFTTVS